MSFHLTRNSYQQAKQQCNRSRGWRRDSAKNHHHKCNKGGASQGFFNGARHPLSLGECKHSNLGSHIKSHLNKMTEAPVNIHSATASQVKLAGGVALVLRRQNRRGQKRRLALATMRMSGKDPSAKVAPDRTVRCVWIVAKDQSRPIWFQVTQHLLRRKVRPPVIVQTNDLQTINRAAFIPKHHDTQPKQPYRDLVGHVGLRPAAAIVMIAESRQSGAPPARQVAKHSIQLWKCAFAPVTNKVAGDHENIRTQIAHPIQCRHQIPIIDTRSHMKIADLNQPLSSQAYGQLRYGKRSLDDLHPVGFDAPDIESSRHSRTDEPGASPPEEFSTRERQNGNPLNMSSLKWGL